MGKELRVGASRGKGILLVAPELLKKTKQGLDSKFDQSAEFLDVSSAKTDADGFLKKYVDNPPPHNYFKARYAVPQKKSSVESRIYKTLIQ